MIRKFFNSHSIGVLSIPLSLAVLFLSASVVRGAETASGLEEQLNQAAKYCSIEKYRLGSRLYRQALRQNEANLPADRYLEIAQSLADCDDAEGAIDALETFTSANPKIIEAKVLLANLLSWNGRLLQAVVVADQVLAVEPKNRQARLAKANAASWSGDFYVALPVFEKLLAEEEDFDTRLGYTYALLASGSYREAKYSHWWLYAANVPKRHTTLEVRQALIDQGRRNVSWKTEYLNDRSHSRRFDHILSYNLPFERSGMTLSLRQQKAEDPWTALSQELNGVEVAGRWRMSPAWKLASELAWVKAGTHQQTFDELNLLLSSKTQTGRWLWDAELSRELYDDTASILAHHIIRSDIYNHAQYTVNDWIRLNGELRGTDYSDDNKSYELVLRSRYSIALMEPRIEIGYKYYQQDFQRQSGGGYYAPDNTAAHELTLGFTHYSKSFEGSGEIFYGRQSTSIAVTDQTENIAGLTLNLGYNVMNVFSVNASLEGSHSALGKVNGYYYYLASLGISAFF
ncbi:MAG: hypothetical protein HY272_09180 [Gammaproteobacteria bacterium]|nr:hypothetical protein [Gammaproteobacteria bacterium]